MLEHRNNRKQQIVYDFIGKSLSVCGVHAADKIDINKRHITQATEINFEENQKPNRSTA